MDKLLISGAGPLDGEIRISGSKNAALPILAGVLLADTPVHLRNLPHLKDINTMLALLRTMGVGITITERMTVEIDVSSMDEFEAPYDLVRTMRADFVLGPMLARFGKADVSFPGGCAIGCARSISTSRGSRLWARKLRSMAVISARGRLTVCAVPISLWMWSLLGGLKIYYGGDFSARYYHFRKCCPRAEIVDLANFLVAMGAQIEGIGSDRLVVHGVERLQGCSYPIMADRIETGTSWRPQRQPGAASCCVILKPIS